LPPCGSIPSALAAIPDRLDFTGTPSGLLRGPQGLSLIDPGGGALAWTATRQNIPWLAIAPATGSTPTTLSVVPHIVGMDPGLHAGAIVFEAAAGNSPFHVPVTLALQPGPQTVQLLVVTGLDDGMELTRSAARMADTVLRIGRGSVTALRFPSIPLTHGAQIRSAVLRTYSPYATSAVVNLRYYAEVADNCLPLAPTVGEFSRRPATVNVVNDIPGPWVARTYNASPDLVAIIQEIVDRPGWAPGNALTLFSADHSPRDHRSLTHGSSAALAC
jgi:hypothetical protein